MDWTQRQTPIDIRGTTFPRFPNRDSFWYVKQEFVAHSTTLLTSGQMFSMISGKLSGEKWVCNQNPVSEEDVAFFLFRMRLFYMKKENMSIHSFSQYMERHVRQGQVRRFFKHMRDSWKEVLNRPAIILGSKFGGRIKSNKDLIDAVLYSGRFHSQEKHRKRYDELAAHMDESLILKCAYNAMHSGYQMNQITRAVKRLQPDHMVVYLPDHLRHEWDNNCPYTVVR